MITSIPRETSASTERGPGASPPHAFKMAVTAGAVRAVRQVVAVLLATGVVLLAVGCHHQRQQAYQPAPPPVQSSDRGASPGHGASPDRNSSRSTHEAARAPSQEHGFDDTRGKPILVETGMASWYGPNFNHRNAADGVKFDQNAMTAAHKTLPMGTTVKVTNLANGEEVTVRITDRGPFAKGRILDMSEGAAKAIGLYRMGVAEVRIEAYAHATADPAGRWCVQTGAFKSQGDAMDLKNALAARYKGARVIEFAGPTGYWVRIDPAQHERTEALAIQDWIGNPDPNAKPYLVRLD